VAHVADVERYEIGAGKGAVSILFDAASANDPAAYVGVLTAEPGMWVRNIEHQHDTATELLYVLEGEAVMTVKGIEHPVRPHMAIQIPPATKHAVRVTSEEPVVVVQFYTPSGPEQRFKK
jgi:mannose-6-phosphate isomerase-like protein (cupin superfamily)